MIKLSTGTAWGILCSVTLHAASSFTEDLPFTTFPAHRLGPAQVQYELVTPPVGGTQKPSQANELIINDAPAGDLHRDDFFSKFANPAHPAPASMAYFGLITGDESASPIHYNPSSGDQPTVSRSGNDSLTGLAGLALYGFGVFAIYRGIRKASGKAES